MSVQRKLIGSLRARRSLSPSQAMSSASKGPVRLVLFDIFDTLCTPRIPIHEQYHEEGIRAGLPSDKVTPDSVRSAFKPAFKAMEARWPVYGKHSTPALSPEQWWTELIKQCMLEAAAAEKEVEGAIPTLAPALLSRFESEKGYRNFPETLSSLRKLKESGVKISIVSNADPRILRTIDALGISPYLTHPPTLSWEVEVGKPDRRIFEAACRACGETPGQGILFVGDELKADYHGSTDAGLEARLIRRQGSWSDGANRSPGEDLVGVHCVETLEKIVAEVEERNHGG